MRDTPVTQDFVSVRLLAAVLALVTASAVVALAPAPTVFASDAQVVQLRLEARDLAYDDRRDVLYASMASSDATYGNRIVTIDPRTLSVLSSVYVGTNPNALAVTPDGAALYVGIDGQGAVKRLSLPTMTPEWSATLGAGGSTLTAADIAVSPGGFDTIAVSLRVPNTSGAAGLMVLDAGTARPTTVPAPIGMSHISFGSLPTQLFGSDDGSSAEALHRYTIDSAGISLTEEVWGFGGGALAVHGGLTFSAFGKVVDVSTATMFLADTLPSAYAVAVDHTANVVYYVDQEFAGTTTATLTAYDTATRQQIGTWPIPGRHWIAGHMVMAGGGRVAYLDSFPGDVYLTVVDVDAGAAGEYTPLTPMRILDTREGIGRDGAVGPVTEGRTIDVAVAGVGGVPASDVAAVVMNVTAVAPTRDGYLTVFPTGVPRPTISSLNFPAHKTVANLVTMPLGASGQVSVYNPFGSVDVLFDVAGFYATDDGQPGLRFHALRPTRVMDTRFGQGGPNIGIVGGSTTSLRLSDTAGVPIGAGAVALNVTVTEPTAPSFVTVWPADVDRPVVSNLNFIAGDTRANQVIVRLSDDGSFQVFNLSGVVDVVIDVVGYFDQRADGDRGRFVPVQPFRSLDTRLDSPFPAPGDLWPGDIIYDGEADDTMSAYVLNVTVTETRGSGYVTAYPFAPTAGQPPLASTLNYTDGQTVPNHAIVTTGPYIGFFNFGGYTHLIVDVFGAFT